MKTCSKCGESKPLEAYSTDKRAQDGLDWCCKPCKSEIASAWRANNREHYLENKRKYYVDNREKILLMNAKVYANDLDYLAKRRAQAKAHRDNNPGIHKGTKLRRRANEVSNGVNLVSAAEIAAIAAMPCMACGLAGPSEVDHIVPVARGGSHTIGNLMPLCRSCNASKKDLLYIEWKYSKRPQALKAFAAP